MHRNSLFHASLSMQPYLRRGNVGCGCGPSAPGTAPHPGCSAAGTGVWTVGFATVGRVCPANRTSRLSQNHSLSAFACLLSQLWLGLYLLGRLFRFLSKQGNLWQKHNTNTIHVGKIEAFGIVDKRIIRWHSISIYFVILEGYKPSAVIQTKLVFGFSAFKYVGYLWTQVCCCHRPHLNGWATHPYLFISMTCLCQPCRSLTMWCQTVPE